MAMPETSYTRIANTTAYTANDALSDSTHSPSALTFAGVAASAGGGGWLTGCTAIDSANESTLPQLKLYLFDGTVAPTATNDNAEFNLTDANSQRFIGAFDLNAFEAIDATSGTNGNSKCDAAPSGVNAIRFDCGSGITDLYGLVKVTNAYTPVASEEIRFKLHVLRD